MAKLTEKDRASIIKEYAAGKSVRELAKKFTVSPTGNIKDIEVRKKFTKRRKKFTEKFTAEAG